MKSEKATQTYLRFAVAGGVGIVVTGVCLYLTWGGAGMYVRYPQWFTEKTLKATDRSIKAYRQKKGVLPKSLGALQAVSDGFPVIEDGGAVWDSWRHPIWYEVHAGKYLLVSYGRDGRVGGVGLDCDLTNVKPRPPEAGLPLLQVLFDPLAQGMVWMSFLSGAMAFLLTFGIVRPADLSREGGLALTLKLLVTLVATLCVASIITMLHVPSGH